MLCFLAWTGIGLVIGYLAAKLTHVKAVDLPWYLGLGVLGALLAGWRFSGLSLQNAVPPSFNVYSLVVAVAGAVASLIAYHLLFHSILERADDQMY